MIVIIEMRCNMFIGTIFLITILPFLLFYVLKAWSLYKLANGRYENAWLAWIPIGHEYLMSEMLHQYMNLGFSYYTPHAFWVMLVVIIAEAVLGSVPVLGVLSLIVLLYARFCFYRDFYYLYDKKNFTIFGVLSAIIPFSSIIMNFVVAKYPAIDDRDFRGMKEIF